MRRFFCSEAEQSRFAGAGLAVVAARVEYGSTLPSRTPRQNPPGCAIRLLFVLFGGSGGRWLMLCDIAPYCVGGAAQSARTAAAAVQGPRLAEAKSRRTEMKTGGASVAHGSFGSFGSF